MLAVTEWTLAAAVEAIVTSQAAKVFWSQVEYLGLVSALPLMLMFVLAYVRPMRPLRRAEMALLWSVPAITLLLAWTNAWHGLIWSGFSPGSAAANILIYQHGPGFWVAIAYDYAVLGLSLFLLLKEFLRAQRLYRWQIGAMALGSLFPGIAGFAYAFKFSPVPGLDWTPVSCVAAGLVFAWNIFRFQFLDLVPVAREMVIEQLTDGMIVLDGQDRIVDINPAARRLLHGLAETWIGQPAKTILAPYFDLSARGAGGERVEFTLGESQPHYLELLISRLHSQRGDPAGSLLVLRDITSRKQAELGAQEANRRLQAQLQEINRLRDQLHEQAIRDVLTGLFNRRYLEETLGRELTRAERENYPLSLLMIDIDRFKQVNDAYSHQAGDLMLQRLGEVLGKRTRYSDIACRFGGDEFVVVMPGTAQEVAVARAEELRSAFAEGRTREQENEIGGTISVGVATFPVHAAGAEELLRVADQALYLAKSRGRNCVAVS